MVPEPTHMMLRASALMDLSPAMIFVGVYSSDTYTAVALADREKVQIHPDADENRCQTFSVTINPRQVQAIATHIRTSDNVLTQINIANLHFVCLRTGSGCMTGMSNFNMDYQTDNTKDVNKTLFELSKKRYGSQELLDGAHALQISAIIKEGTIIIGLCKAGSCSSLKLIKEILEQPQEQPVEKIILPTSGSRRSQFTAKSSVLRKSLKSASSLIDNPVDDADDVMNIDGQGDRDINETEGHKDSISNLIQTIEQDENKPTLEEDFFIGTALVDRRPSTRTPEERRRDQMKRETEFCEDWRSATIRSIEALKMIGPFSQDQVADDDQSPLIENIDMEPHSGAKSIVDEGNVGEETHQSGHITKKRPSRATFV